MGGYCKATTLLIVTNIIILRQKEKLDSQCLSFINRNRLVFSSIFFYVNRFLRYRDCFLLEFYLFFFTSVLSLISVMILEKILKLRGKQGRNWE